MGIDESAVKDLAQNLNKEFENFVQDASLKLKQQDSQCNKAREELKERCDLVRIFLQDFSPKAHDKVFAGNEELMSASGKGEKDPQIRELFANKALPTLLDHIAEDQKILKDCTEEMKGFVSKYFKGSSLSSENDPVPLFKGILKLLNDVKGGGTGKDPRDDRDGGRGRGGGRKDSRSPPRKRSPPRGGGDRGRGGGRKDSRSPPRKRSPPRGGGGRKDSQSPPRKGGGGRKESRSPPRKSPPRKAGGRSRSRGGGPPGGRSRSRGGGRGKDDRRDSRDRRDGRRR